MDGDHVNALLEQPGDSGWSDLLCLGSGGPQCLYHGVFPIMCVSELFLQTGAALPAWAVPGTRRWFVGCRPRLGSGTTAGKSAELLAWQSDVSVRSQWWCRTAGSTSGGSTEAGRRRGGQQLHKSQRG